MASSPSDTKRAWAPATNALHAAATHIEGSLSTPIFRSVMYEDAGGLRYEDVKYGRLCNTPSQTAIQTRLAVMEGAEACVVTASGMAAIASTLLSLLKAGDHFLMQNTVYGGAQSLASEDFAALNITHTSIDVSDPSTWEGALQDNTKVIYVESITNPLIEVGELAEVVLFAKNHGLVSVIDNTFATPLFFSPLKVGYDLVIHSATKYLNGHGDVLAGAVMGSAERVREVKLRILHYGGSLDPTACFLLERGLKTLPLRMAQHCKNAQALAEAAEAHEAVAKVNYPGLPSNGSHGNATAHLSGFSGVFSFELAGGPAAVQRFLKELELPLVAPSLGDVESLVTLPATTSHAGLTAEERALVGISDTLVRFSTGIEDTQDLLDDFVGALDAALMVTEVNREVEE